MVDSKYINITDFGFSNVCKDDDVLHTVCGTPQYCAPEIMLTANPPGYSGMKSDAWSCGIILFTLLAGFPPFTGETSTQGPDSSRVRGDDSMSSQTGSGSVISERTKEMKSLLAKIGACQVMYPPSIPAGAQEVISKLFVHDPAKRATLTDIMLLDWFKTNYEPCKTVGRQQKRPRVPKQRVDDWTSPATVATSRFLPTRQTRNTLAMARKPQSAAQPPSSKRRTSTAAAARRASGDANHINEGGTNLALRSHDHVIRGGELPAAAAVAARVASRRPFRSSDAGVHAERDAASLLPSPGHVANIAVEGGSVV